MLSENMLKMIANMAGVDAGQLQAYLSSVGNFINTLNSRLETIEQKQQQILDQMEALNERRGNKRGNALPGPNGSGDGSPSIDN